MGEHRDRCAALPRCRGLLLALARRSLRRIVRGDFGVLRINGRGPGGVCPNDGSTALVCEFHVEPRWGSRFEGVRLLNGYGGVLREWDAIDGQSFTHHLDPPEKKSFYVAQFYFSDGGGQRWEVWTNPVWVEKP